MSVSINGLISKSEALNLELQAGKISNIVGVIRENEKVNELYEISILACKISNSPIYFKDMVLNVLKGEILINIIGIDFENNGILIKYKHNFSINIESFMEVNIEKILFLDGDFIVNLNGEIIFDLVAFIPLENKRNAKNPLALDDGIFDGDYFDKEFI